MIITNQHFVTGRPIKEPFPDNCRQAVFGLGCFWGAERVFWQHEGIYTTAVGYAAGLTPNPTYEEVCSGLTGHNEVVLAVYDTTHTDYAALLKIFWEAHDPTEGMRQGNDIGTQYRSGIYTFNQEQARERGFDPITTEILPATEFYYAEDYHQQFLAKNPAGYCGLGGTGVSCVWSAG
jgi:peptide-methionine (S)-S-oxide reductase